jgi:hypothetical protein
MEMRLHAPAALASLLAAAGCATSDPRDHVEKNIEIPRYDVLSRDGPFELRAYAATIVARTDVDGDLDDANSEGFSRLAGYIFGKNRARAEIAMTAPVSATAASTGSKIAMTAPVGASAAAAGGPWEITFTMPSRYTLAELPIPLDPRVTLVERTSSCVAAVVFAGLSGKDVVAAQTEALRGWLTAAGHSARGAPTIARYNTPWTLPFNRRNEVLIEVSCPQT